MENKGLVLTINCENAELKERYAELEQKMSEDKAFAERCEACKNPEELYLAYKDFGYTDMELADFEAQLTQLVKSFPSSEEGVQELKTEDLKEVVGGFSLTSLALDLFKKLPFYGPMVEGVAKFFEDMNSAPSETNSSHSNGRVVPGILVPRIFK